MSAVDSPAPVLCPSCGKDMKPAHVACPWCIADGVLRHSRHLAEWTAARNTRVGELLLWS